MYECREERKEEEDQFNSICEVDEEEEDKIRLMK